jgi:uncharacterized membrane protein
MDISFFFKFLFLQQIFGFIFLSIIPGILILLILKCYNISI